MCGIIVVPPCICLFTYCIIGLYVYKGIGLSVYMLAIMDVDALFPSARMVI
jgi:hypothetical protein